MRGRWIGAPGPLAVPVNTLPSIDRATVTSTSPSRGSWSALKLGRGGNAGYRRIVAYLNDRHDAVVEREPVRGHRQRLNIANYLLGRLARRREDMHFDWGGIRAGDDTDRPHSGNAAQCILEFRQEAQCGHGASPSESVFTGYRVGCDNRKARRAIDV